MSVVIDLRTFLKEVPLFVETLHISLIISAFSILPSCHKFIAATRDNSSCQAQCTSSFTLRIFESLLQAVKLAVGLPGLFELLF